MNAQIEINSEDLRNFLKSLTVITNEGILSLSKDGISTSLVDPANVLMGEFNIPAADLQKYSISDLCDVALRFDLLAMYTAESGKNEIVYLTLENNSLTIRYTGIEYTQRTLNAKEVRSIPKVPNLNFASSIELSTQDITKNIKACTKIDSFVVFECSKDKFELSAKYNKDGVSAVIENASIKTTGDSYSRYSSDYLTDVLKGLKHSTDVVIRFATDFPLKIETSLCKSGKMSYMIAPRIEAD